MHNYLTQATLLFALAAPAAGLTGCCAREGAAAEGFDAARYVNPFIGASTSTAAAGVYHGLGKTFPGATTPFGMVQVSPNTITGGDNSPGYSYEHTTIEGFAFTQMNGVGWFGELGNLLVMPTTGPLQKIAGKEDGSIAGYRSHYDKTTETARAGYYAADLTDYGIRVESSATPHCGILRFTFPENDLSRIQIDLARRVGGTSERQYVEVIDDRTIAGWMKCTPATGGWGNGEGHADYTVYFYAQLSEPMRQHGFWSADIPDTWVRKKDEVVSIPYLQRVAQAPVVTGERQIEGKHIGFYTEFPTREGQQVEFKAGISFVDMEGARKNFEAEIASKTFDEVAGEAYAQWNRELNRIRIEGGTDEEKTIFYTALYHTMIDPRIYTDTDGRYMGADGKPRSTEGRFTKRTVFSGWDVFRSQMPLQTIINPELVDDLLASLTTMAQESGREYFERWEIVNAYSGCMLGNPALSVLADAYAKGIRGYDVERAYRYAVNTSRLFGNDSLGYTPSDLCISHTLEYAYTDWCVSQLAARLGKTEDAKAFAQKSRAYRNIFDREKGWFRPRRADGSWAPWPENARTTEWYGCIESTPYQQGWFVPHDVEGMVELMGGREAVLADLNEFFEKAPADMHWNAYYNHANEPVHLVPFLFNRLGEPWSTQRWTRFICRQAYADKVEGIVGNEDAGQMSAWYVLAAAGIHPACPGDTRMEITSPVFDRIEFRLDPRYAQGGTFAVVAHGNSPENIYIQRAVLNGEELAASHIDFAQIAAGGTLELYMGPEPNRQWGIDRPTER
ncbi:GH92 family glycosyl hydrolase [uncultured Alistipes sp.]|uniref:GH92 family glycosyl hydrolase n=1 Tax=uncultured Alistipes sp. TaxID=538949 RepID=UPI00258E80EF|nr:GH92 family glycosyl hydrolase [uncultured Alistipes sp.]